MNNGQKIARTDTVSNIQFWPEIPEELINFALATDTYHLFNAQDQSDSEQLISDDPQN